MSALVLNGVTIYVTDAAKTLRKIGESIESDNGTRRWVQAVTSGGAPIFKRTWDISAQDVSEATRAQLETAAKINATFTYVDQHGTSYTVQTEADCYKDSVSFIGGDGTTLLYNVTLTLFEA